MWCQSVLSAIQYCSNCPVPTKVLLRNLSFCELLIYFWSHHDYRRSACHVLQPNGHLPLLARRVVPLHCGQQLQVDVEPEQVLKDGECNERCACWMWPGYETTSFAFGRKIDSWFFFCNSGKCLKYNREIFSCATKSVE